MGVFTVERVYTQPILIGGVSVEFAGKSSNADAAHTYHFPDHAAGKPKYNRRVVVGVVGSNGGGLARSVSSVEVNGISAELVTASASGGTATAELWIAEVPDGETVDVDVTFPDEQARCGISVWAVNGLTDNTPIDTGGANTATTPGGSNVTLDTVAGGVVVGVGIWTNSGIGSPVVTWNNMDKRFEDTIEAVTDTHDYHGADVKTQSSSATVGADESGGTGTANCPFVVASFGNPILPPPLDGLTITGAWSLSRDLFTSFAGGTRYTNSGSSILTIPDQSGNGRTWTTVNNPQLAMVNGREGATFGASSSANSGYAWTQIITTTSAYMVISFLADTISDNYGVSYGVHGLLGDSSGNNGIMLGKSAGVGQIRSYSFSAGDVHADAPGAISTGVAYVFSFRQEGGNLYARLNAGTEASVANAALALGGDQPLLGAQIFGTHFFGKIVELFTTSTIPDATKRTEIETNMMTWIGASPLPATPPLDGLSGVTGAWSMSRDLLTSFVGGTRYTTSGSDVTNLNDQSGNGRTFTTPGTDPVLATAGPLSRAAVSIPGTSAMSTAAGDPLSDFISASAGYIIISGIFSTLTANQANAYQNHPIIMDNSAFVGIHGKTGGLAFAYNWDGTIDAPSVASIAAGTAYVFEWRHEGGTLGLRVNGGTEATTASGNTTTLTGLLTLGGTGTGTSIAFNGYVFEVACFSTVPSLAERDALVANFKAWIGA